MGAKDSRPSCISYEDAVKRGMYKNFRIPRNEKKNPAAAAVQVEKIKKLTSSVVCVLLFNKNCALFSVAKRKNAIKTQNVETLLISVKIVQ